MTDRATRDRIRTAKGQRRKRIEETLAVACRDWRAGRPGDLIMGELEREFFAGASGFPCDPYAKRGADAELDAGIEKGGT